jgi:hypothetical protein
MLSNSILLPALDAVANPVSQVICKFKFFLRVSKIWYCHMFHKKSQMLKKNVENRYTVHMQSSMYIKVNQGNLKICLLL